MAKDTRVLLKARSSLEVCVGVVCAPGSIHTSGNNVMKQKPTDLDWIVI